MAYMVRLGILKNMMGMDVLLARLLQPKRKSNFAKGF